MTIRTELLALQESSNGGLLRCGDVVEWARENPDSALHSALEWDDESAAVAYRIWQVRRLITLHISYGSDDPKVVSLSIDRATGGYRPLSEISERPDLAAILLKDALAELERMQAKYARIEALAGIWREVAEARKKTNVKPSRSSARAPARHSTREKRPAMA